MRPTTLLETNARTSEFGHLRPFMPQKTRVGNDRSQSTTDVARRRNRNEKLYKAGARSSVTLAAQTLIEGPLFQKSNWRYRPVAVLQLRENRSYADPLGTTKKDCHTNHRGMRQ